MAWSNEDVLLSPADFFSSLQKDIVVAQHSIDIETYILDKSPVASSIVRDLQAAARRGVKVRLLVDGIGSPGFTQRFKELLHLGIELRVFNPLPWPASRFYWPELSRPHHFLRWLRRLNQRNHRKVAIIDAKILYAGGINISSDELSWEDVAVRVEGAALAVVSHAFAMNWRVAFSPGRKIARHKQKIRLQDPLVLQSYSFASRRHCHRRFLQYYKSAQDKVWLTTGYFVPTLRMLKALSECRRRQVDVRLVLSSHSDVPFIPWMSRFFFRRLLRNGVKIYLHQHKFIHAKVSIADQNAIVGSSNLNHRSSHRDFEANIVVQQADNTARLEKWFLDLCVQSEELTLHSQWMPPWYQDIVARLLLRIRRWF